MKKSNKAEWRSTNVQGLYEYRPAGTAENARGVYYSRYSVNGKRTFRSLETDVFEHAKIKHAKRNVDVEKDRQRGADLAGDCKTLGALLTETKARLDAGDVSENTRLGRRGNIKRLVAHWQRGSFETFLARNVTAEVISELREHLLKRAEWRKHFTKVKDGVPYTAWQKVARQGFKPLVVDQTLWVLKVMLDIAAEKMVIIENPFLKSRVLEGRRNSRDRITKPQIPTREDMARIIADMRGVPDAFHCTPEKRVELERNAAELADHAELLCYSGMRREEAAVATLGDDHGATFKIHGTKSETSDRVIDVNPALRAVLDRIKSRRVGDKTRVVVFNECRLALQRACKRLGLPKLTNHHLRHYFASVCISSGVDVLTVSKWLGHADGGALALKTYAHLLKDFGQAAAQKVDFSVAARLKTA